MKAEDVFPEADRISLSAFPFLRFPADARLQKGSKNTAHVIR